MSQLRIGVIGVGHLGALHAKMLADLPDVHLAGVYDMKADRAKSIAADYGTKAFADMRDLLAEVDAVTIATSTSAHFATACKVLEAGKPVFIEKPITETPAEADQLCRLAEQKGLAIQVGHIERFNPAILALKGYEIKPMSWSRTGLRSSTRAAPMSLLFLT